MSRRDTTEEDYPFTQPALNGLGPVDAHAVARMSRIPTSTLNVWSNRGQIPWLGRGTPGRARWFNINLALHLALTGELVMAGFPVSEASNIAVSVIRSTDLSQPGLWALIGGKRFPDPKPRQVLVAPIATLDEAEERLGGRCAFTAVPVGEVLRRVIEIARQEQPAQADAA